MKPLKKLLLTSIIFCVCGDLYAGPASSKLSVLAGELIKGYGTKAGAANATLAVFPFSCEEKLRKQRVGFAVSELMSHRFVADRNFTVVERGEIDKLLSEQKLQASGAADSATAVRLGKMAGANVLLLGNLNRVAGVYQVNARLVNAETGEVVTSAYTELPADAFEDDARVYLNLVPQEQTLGLYGVMNYRHNANDTPIFIEASGSNQTSFRPRSFTALMAGGGLLYRPHKNMQVNAELVTSKVGKGAYITKVHTFSGPPEHVFYEKHPLELTTVSLMTSYVNRLSGKWHWLAGAGLQYIIGVVSDAKEDQPPSLLVKTGIEYKPQSRIGLGVNVRYELKRTIFRSEISDNVMLKMNPLSIETVLAMYF